MMSSRRGLYLVLVALLAIVTLSCGKGKTQGEISVVSINTNPATVATGAVVELTASISAPGRSVSDLNKHWSVTAGTLLAAPPDFSLLLKGTAKATSESSLDTTASKVYWVTPSPGTTTVTLAVETASKSRTITVGQNPVTLSVSDGVDGQKVCTVLANNVTDLYQAAFRINFSSAWKVVGTSPGSFLGGSGDTLWIGMSNQNGFVPCAITRRGNAAGVTGSGTLATIIFEPASGASAAREAAGIDARPFDLSMAILRSSKDEPIGTP